MPTKPPTRQTPTPRYQRVWACAFYDGRRMVSNPCIFGFPRIGESQQGRRRNRGADRIPRGQAGSARLRLQERAVSMDIREVGRQAALAKAVELVGRVDMVEQDDVRQLADAAVVAALHRVTEAMTEKLTPALNTGTAFDLLIIVGQVIRDLGAAFTPAEPPQQAERECPMMPNWAMVVGDVIQRMLGIHVHRWVRASEHPMHHKCAGCGKEIYDWVW